MFSRLSPLLFNLSFVDLIASEPCPSLKENPSVRLLVVEITEVWLIVTTGVYQHP